MTTYTWTDNPTESGIATCDTDVLNECLMYLKYENITPEIETLLNSKVAKSDCEEVYTVITEYVNGASGYRIWSSGYCEQWGNASISATTGSVAFTKTFADTNYMILTQSIKTSYAYEVTITSKTATGFDWVVNSTTNYIGCNWKASGYLAEGQY